MRCTSSPNQLERRSPPTRAVEGNSYIRTREWTSKRKEGRMREEEDGRRRKWCDASVSSSLQKLKL